MPQTNAAVEDFSERRDSALAGRLVSNGAGSQYVPTTPENWFVDPIRLVVPGRLHAGCEEDLHLL